MAISFEKVKFKNVLSFGNKITEFDFTSSKKSVITAANGKGKSVILDVIVFVLFGKPFRKIKKNQIVNDTNNSDLYIELDFFINDTEYKVIRGIKPNLFEIYIDGDLVPQDSTTKDYQRYLERDILNLNYSTFTQIVILGSSSYVPFMRMPSGTKREIIEDILNISVFSKMNEILKEEIKAESDKIESINNDKILAKKQYKFVYDKYQENTTSKEEKIRIKQEKKTIAEDKKIESQNNIFSLEKDLITDIEDSTPLKKKKQKAENYKSGIKRNYDSVVKQIKFLNENDTCSICSSDLDPEFKEDRMETLEQKKGKFSDAIIELQKNIEQINEQITEIELQELANKNVNDKIQTEKNNIKSLEKEIKYIESDIEEIQNKTYDFISEDEITKLSEKVKECDTKLREKRKSFDIMKHGIDILKDTGAKTAIIKFYLPLINQTINKYLEAFDFNFIFTFDENFDEVIKNKNAVELGYGNFSEGEKKRIDLSLLLTFREIAKKKNSASTNLLFFDEILDSALDADGVEKFLDVLEDLVDSNIYVISHNSSITHSFFGDSYTVEKNGKFSEIKKVA